MSYRPNLPAAGQAVTGLTVKTDSVGTDLLTINRAGVDYSTAGDTYAEYVRTPVAPLTLSDSTGTITIDLTVNPWPRTYDCTLSGTGRTLAVTGTPVSGKTVFLLRLKGSGSITTYPGSLFWRGGAGAPTLTGRDEIVFQRVGTEWWASAVSFA